MESTHIARKKKGGVSCNTETVNATGRLLKFGQILEVVKPTVRLDEMRMLIEERRSFTKED